MLFEVEVKENQTKELLETGIDEITFLLSLNEGEPVKPFHKIASGGELSRSMLALKILYGNSHDLGLMVFDLYSNLNSLVDAFNNDDVFSFKEEVRHCITKCVS